MKPFAWLWIPVAGLSVKCPESLPKVLFPANVTMVDAGGCNCVKEHLKHSQPHFCSLTMPHYPSLLHPPCSPRRRKKKLGNIWLSLWERERERIGRPWKLGRILSWAVQESIVVVAISGEETLILWKYPLLHLNLPITLPISMFTLLSFW